MRHGANEIWQSNSAWQKNDGTPQIFTIIDYHSGIFDAHGISPEFYGTF